MRPRFIFQHLWTCFGEEIEGTEVKGSPIRLWVLSWRFGQRSMKKKDFSKNEKCHRSPNSCLYPLLEPVLWILYFLFIQSNGFMSDDLHHYRLIKCQLNGMFHWLTSWQVVFLVLSPISAFLLQYIQRSEALSIPNVYFWG